MTVSNSGITENSSNENRVNWWARTYRNTDAVSWDTGRPQPEIIALSEAEQISGHVLDVGCGLGTEAVYLAEQGHSVVGVDSTASAIERARARTPEDDLQGDVTFTVANALTLSEVNLCTFQTIVDVGMFHTLETDDYVDYVTSLGSVVQTGGRVILLEFGAEAPADWGPNPVSEDDIRYAFDEDWKIETIESAPFETRQRDVSGIRSTITRTE